MIKLIRTALLLAVVARPSPAQNLAPRRSPSCRTTLPVARAAYCAGELYLDAIGRLAHMPAAADQPPQSGSEAQAVAAISEMLFRMREAIRIRSEECASLRSLDAAQDTSISEFADAACNAFALQSSTDSFRIEYVKRATSGSRDDRSVSEKADEIAVARQRAEASSRAVLFASIALTVALLESPPGAYSTQRLRLTPTERGALRAQASRIQTVRSAGSGTGTVYQQAATLVVEFLAQPWSTRN